MKNACLLNEVPIKTKVKVIKIDSKSNMRRKLMAMGIIRNTDLTVDGKAPLGDPISISLRGYHLTLRNNEAKDILVEVV